MAQNFVTDAINLRSYNLSEADKIVVMYSKEKGLIKGVAKGTKKPTSKLGARMDMLVANKLMLHKGKNLDTICQAEALNTFLNLRQDMDKLFYSMYCSEIVNNFGIENDPNSFEVYDLFYNFLNTLAATTKKEDILLSVLRFQLKMMYLSGYSLELDSCSKCGEKLGEENLYFAFEHGGLICSNCRSTSVNAIKFHYKIKDFLKTLQSLDFNQKTRYDDLATERICDFCFNLLKKHIEYHSPKKFKTTGILEGIK
ncbi:MAG: DNA repair protein RecO [Candidatus Gastranaerophilales bacterium]|nr:DNA repair protein RecO [Candidatus Gastranaerophilales bacterium]